MGNRIDDRASVGAGMQYSVRHALPTRGVIRIGWPHDKNITLYHGTGCDSCYDSGYRGRIGIYEMLLVDDELRAMVLNSPTVDAVRRWRERTALPSLRDAGFEVVRRGQGTIEEILRAVYVESKSDVEMALEAETNDDRLPSLPNPQPQPVPLDKGQ